MQPTGVLDTAKATNPLKDLLKFGQSVWLDYIRRDLITSGELERLIQGDGLRGMTSNPAIFEKAITGSSDYNEAMRKLIDEGKSVQEIYEALVIEDIQRAADLFAPVYARTRGIDGYVSLEVSPLLAHDTAGSIAEARRLTPPELDDRVRLACIQAGHR